jgi:hypothetical protein
MTREQNLADFDSKKDLLAQLLALNLEGARRIGQGESVTPLGVPKDYPMAKQLVTNDCAEASTSK